MDVLKGELHVTHGYVDLGTLTWTKTNGRTENIKRFNGNLMYIAGNSYNIKPAALSSEYCDIICSSYATINADKTYLGSKTGIAVLVSANGQVCIHDPAYYEATAEEFKSAMSGVYACYALATEQIISIDPITIKTLLGNNTIWTNADNLELKYYKQNFQESVNDVNHFDIYINPQDDENLVVAADMTNPNSSIWINPNGPNYVMPNVNVSKSDNVTTVTTTNNIGTTNSVEIVDGVDGITPNFTIGEVEALPFDDDAIVEITGTQENPVLNFGIPKILQDEETEMAAIATFDDGAYDMPLKSCIC